MCVVPSMRCAHAPSPLRHADARSVSRCCGAQTFSDHTDQVWGVAYNPSGTRFVSVGDDGSVLMGSQVIRGELGNADSLCYADSAASQQAS